MTEHWIDAATAVSLVRDGPHDLDGRRALCVRAHSGLVKTKAQLLVLKEKKLVSRQENVPLPPEFWWAEGDEALEQNWTSGDFSTWIEERHLQAFGVTFALSGLLELLPSEQRALYARRLSVAGNPAWIPARAARSLAVERGEVSSSSATTVILDYARLGFVTGCAVLAQRFDGRADGTLSLEDRPVLAWEQREWDIPASFWEDFQQAQGAMHDWERGEFPGIGLGPNGICLMRLSGVYFLRKSLQVLLPAAEETPAPAPAPTPLEQGTPTEAAPKAKFGGRPPAEWWDDLWCHVCRLLYEGGLIPKTQADIEKAMHTWANDHEHEPAVSTIRDRASKLFKALKQAENSPTL